MTQKPKKPTRDDAAIAEALDDAQVAEYLRRHPEFLVAHPELIAALVPPAREYADGVVDLQQFMLERLRGDVAAYKRAHGELIGASRANLVSQGRIHTAALALLGASSFRQFIHTVTTDLAVLLDVDVAALVIEGDAEGQPSGSCAGVNLVAPGTIGKTLGEGGDIRLRADCAGAPEIFGAAAGLVRSDALLRLRFGGEIPAGLLGLGTRKADAFHPGQSTELLGFLARLIEHCVRAWLVRRC